MNGCAGLRKNLRTKIIARVTTYTACKRGTPESSAGAHFRRRAQKKSFAIAWQSLVKHAEESTRRIKMLPVDTRATLRGALPPSVRAQEVRFLQALRR
jgi:hypothetical protein